MGRNPVFKSTQNREDYIRRIIERRPLVGKAASDEFDDHPSPSAVSDGYEGEAVHVKANFPVKETSQKPNIIFTASATYLPQAGDRVELIWETKNATEVVISPDVGAVPAKGRLWVTVLNDTVYTLTAKNESGSATATVQVDIDDLDKPDDKPDDKEEMWCWIEADPLDVPSGGMTTLRWGVSEEASQARLVVRIKGEEDVQSYDVEYKGIKDVYVKEPTEFIIVGIGDNVSDIVHAIVEVNIAPDIDIPPDDPPANDDAKEIPRFVVDRRPVAAINTYGGLYDQTPTGQARWFYEPGGVQKLIENKIIPMMEIGYERFMMWLPAGSNRQRFMASAQWGPLPEYRKQEFRDVLGPFLKSNPHIDFGIYMGYKIHDPFSLRMPDNEIQAPDLSLDSHRYWFRQTIQPWVDIGAKWFFADASSPEDLREGASEIADMLSIFNLKYGGEALPSRRLDSGEWEVNAEYLREMPWCCIHRYACIRDPELKWRFDPKTTEVGCVFSGHSENDGYVMDFDEIENRIAQGYVPWCMLSSTDERTQFIYNLGMELYEAQLEEDKLDEIEESVDSMHVTSTPETE
tara:strand:+ start:199107 stop:200831 length:1725 start_codon:yes stop_codon:yes gene_type:complete